MAKRVPRRPRGRPPNENDIATDQHVVDMAAALAEVYGLGPQRARDLARALAEGRMVSASKLPRGARKAAPGSALKSYALPRALESYDKRLKRGKIKPRPEVVAWLVAMLRAFRLLDHLLDTDWKSKS
jgi:hypothetical protein